MFAPPSDTFLRYLGNPEINLGGHLSTLGRASMVHLGLTWSSHLFETPLFIEGTVGGALTNSTLGSATPPDRNVGCPALLYFNAGLGYQFDEHWSVLVDAYHASHASLCWVLAPGAPNEGLNGYGIKVGYRF